MAQDGGHEERVLISSDHCFCWGRLEAKKVSCLDCHCLWIVRKSCELWTRNGMLFMEFLKRNPLQKRTENTSDRRGDHLSGTGIGISDWSDDCTKSEISSNIWPLSCFEILGYEKDPSRVVQTPLSELQRVTRLLASIPWVRTWEYIPFLVMILREYPMVVPVFLNWYKQRSDMIHTVPKRNTY